MKKAISSLVLCTVLGSGNLFAATFAWEAKPKGNQIAALKMFVPEDGVKAKAVLVLVPGFNGDGRPMVDDATWQAFAQKNQLAIVGCFFQGDQGGIYYEADKWSGDALLDGLKDLAKQSSRPELAEAPLLLWGHSAGGQFNYNFACWKPERTLAFIANKGAYYTDQPKPAVRKVPALWFCGDQDSEVRIKNITERYNENRKRGALWALVMEPGEGHGVGRSQELSLVFFEEVLGERLDSFGRLQALDPRNGWLGDSVNKTVTKNSTPDAGPKETSWLPGQASAELWKNIVEGTPAAGG